MLCSSVREWPASLMPERVLPNIVVLTTGGTIAGSPVAGLSYQAGKMSAASLLESVPQASTLANITVEALADVGSQDINHAVWARLAQCVRSLLNNDMVDGVVITHGTDTLEETAYFLHLVCQGNKPVVLTGAMRPPHAMGADGPANLYAAIAVAAHPLAASLGVCAVMNEVLFDAVEVQKTDAGGLDAFSSRNQGPLGRVARQGLSLYPGRANGNGANKGRFADCGLGPWPMVHILYAHADMDTTLVQAMLATRPAGIVLAGVGNGNAPGVVLDMLQAAASDGLSVVRATRTMAGLVEPGIEVDDDSRGFIAAGGLSAQKARILLALALQQRKSRDLIRAWFSDLTSL